MNTTVQQVVILAGGLGTRLGELTRRTPKPLLPVAGKPYLEWQIELLRGHGFREFLLLTSYLSEQIEAHFGDGSRWGVKILYSREPRPLGTAAAVKLAEPMLHERFLLMNGDTYFPLDYTELVRRASAEAGKAWLVAVPRDVLGTEAPPGNVRLDERQDRVLEYVRGGREGLEFVHAGMFVLAREWLGLMRNEEGSSVESALCAPLIERGTLRAFVAEERFYDMGTPDQLRTLETAIQARLGLSA